MLYLVTDEKLCLGRNLADVISEAVKGGVNIIQLRKKNINTRNFIEKAEQIKKLLTPLNIPLIINDRVDVALAIKADGVHLGQDDMPYLKAREILGDNAVIGLSVETTEQVKQAEKWNVNYLGISPVFDTKTKTDIKKPWGIQGIRKIRKISRHYLVAIGGLNKNNIKNVIYAGADSIAVVSAICSAANPKIAAQEINSVINHL